MDHIDTYVNYERPTQHNCRVTRKSDAGKTKPYSSLEVKTTYLNGLNIPVSIMMRNGVKFDIPPVTHIKENFFIVDIEYSFCTQVNLNTLYLSNDSSEESSLVKDLMEEDNNLAPYNRVHRHLRYYFSKEELTSKGNSFYAHNLDITISAYDEPGAFHPFSEIGVRNFLAKETTEVNTYGSFGYSIRVIDNEGVFGTKFLNINNKVYRVNPVKNPFYKNGVYFISSGEVFDNNNINIPVSKFFTFEEAVTELGLFNSFIEANTLGNVLETRKKELDDFAFSLKEKENRLKQERMDKEFELEEFKRTLEKMRLQEEEDRRLREIEFKREESMLAAKNMRLKDEINTLEHKRNMLSMERKDHYEEKSYERKDSSEVVKFIPLVIGGLIAIIAAIYKHS